MFEKIELTSFLSQFIRFWYLGQIFLLVDLLEFFSDLGSGG